jgi:phenylpropionate dioxygenase-like ring-hydroxylating dioxygenase large terminal subunit
VGDAEKVAGPGAYLALEVADCPDEEAQATVANSVTILDEDRVICESVQRNLASGSARPAVLSPRHEGGVALVHELVALALGGP